MPAWGPLLLKIPSLGTGGNCLELRGHPRDGEGKDLGSTGRKEPGQRRTAEGIPYRPSQLAYLGVIPGCLKTEHFAKTKGEPYTAFCLETQ